MPNISVKVDGEGVSSGVRSIKRDLSSLGKDVKKTFDEFKQFNTGLKNIRSTNLNSVIRNIESLGTAIELLSLSGMPQVSRELDIFSRNMSKLGAIDFSKTATSMTAFSKSVDRLNDVNFSKTNSGMNALEANLRGLGSTDFNRTSKDLKVFNTSLRSLSKLDYKSVSTGMIGINRSINQMGSIGFSKIVTDIRLFNDSLKSIKQTDISATIKRLGTSVDSLNKKLSKQAIVTEKVSKSLDKLKNKTELANKKQKNFNSTVQQTTTGMGVLRNALAAVTAALGVRELMAYSDSWKQVTSLVRLAVDSEEELIATRQKLVGLSLETRTDLKAQTTLYNRLIIAQKDLGVSQREIMGVIGTVGRALGVTATSALEARGSLIQLSQAFGQGIVRAEEFNSIMEGTPRIAKAAAEGMGLTRMELRKLVLQGMITSKELFIAIQSQTEILKKEFEAVEMTISMAFTNMRTSITQAIGTFDDASGASKRLISAIESLSQVISTTDFASFADDIERIGKQLASIALIIGIGRAATGVIGGFTALAGSIKLATGAIGAFSVALNSNYVALAFIGAYLATGKIEDSFSHMFGEGREDDIQTFNRALTALQIRMDLIQRSAEDKDLLEAILGSDPGGIQKAITTVNNKLKGSKDLLSDIQENPSFFGEDAITKQTAYVQKLENILNINRSLGKQVKSLQSLEDKAAAEKAKAAGIEITAQKAKQIAFLKEKVGLLERIRLQKKAKEMLSTMPVPTPDTQDRWDSIHSALKAIDADGDVANKRIRELIIDETQLAKIFDSTAKSQMNSFKILIPMLKEEQKTREQLLKSQVVQSDRLLSILPKITKQAQMGSSEAITLLKEFNERIAIGGDAAKELAKDFGDSSSQMGSDFKELIRGYNEVIYKQKEHNKQLRKADKYLKELLKTLSADKPSFDLGFDDESLENIGKAVSLFSQINEYFDAQQKKQINLTNARREYNNALISDRQEIVKLQNILFAKKGSVTTIESELEATRSKISLAQESLQALINKGGTTPGDSDITKQIEDTENRIKSLTDTYVEMFEKIKEGQKSVLTAEAEIVGERERNALKRGKQEKTLTDLEKGSITDRLSEYKNLFGTLSSLAKEDSKEKKAMHNISMGFAIAEMAINAQVALTEGVIATIHAATQGDVYTAIARVAAMAAVVGGFLSAIGVSFGGGGGGGASYSSGREAKTTGTVLGDLDAQSESTTKAYELLEDMHAEEYTELQGIKEELESLNTNITGLVSGLVRGFGDFSAEGVGFVSGNQVGEMFEVWDKLDMMDKVFESGIFQFSKKIDPALFFGTEIAGGWTGDIISGLFGGDVETNLEQAGIDIGTMVLGEITSGLSASIQAYQVIKFDEDGGWFHSDKTWFETKYADVDASITQLFTSIFKSVGKSMEFLSESLGTGNLEDVLDYEFTVGQIDLKDKTGEEISKEITAAISTMTDKMASDLFGSLIQQYQKIDEGLFETAIRLAGEKEVILSMLDKTNTAFEGTTIEAIHFSQSLIAVAEDFESLAESFSTYYDKFFSKTEKQEDIKKVLTSSLSKTGLELPESRESYRELFESLDLNTESGKKSYVKLLDVAESADQYYSFLEDIAEKRTGLEIKILELEDKSIEALTMKREIELAATNESLRPLQERIYALIDEAKALALRRTQAKMEVEIMKLEGNARGALEASRWAEYLAMDESLKPLQYRIYLLKDEATALALRRTQAKMEVEIMRLEGNAIGALDAERWAEYSVMEDSLKPLQYRIYLLQDEKKLIEDIAGIGLEDMSKSLLRRSVTDPEAFDIKFDAEKKRKDLLAIEDLPKATKEFALGIIDATEKLDLMDLTNEKLTKTLKDSKEGYESIIDTLKDFRDNLYKTNELLSPREQLLEAKRQFATLLEKDKKTPEDIQKLTGIASDIIDLSAQTNTDTAEYKKDINSVMSVFNKLQADTEKSLGDVVDQLKLSESGLSSSIKEAQRLTAQLLKIEDANSTFWNGSIYNRLGDIVGAITNLNTGLAKGLTPSIPTETGGGGGTLSKVEQSYYDLFGRAGDKEGIDFWETNLAAGNVKDRDVVQAMIESATLLGGYVYDPDKEIYVPGYADGGSFGGGIRMVGEKGSELEITGPSHIVNNSNTMDMILNNRLLMEEVAALRREVVDLMTKQNGYMYQTSDNTKKMNRREEGYEINGTPPVRAN